VHREIVAAGGNDRLAAAHAACETELNCMLAIIRTDFTPQSLTVLHRELVAQLVRGGDAAIHALEDDLELGGRAAMHLALRRSGLEP
jgi:DNA-binding GntR family transcriptional regulator